MDVPIINQRLVDMFGKDFLGQPIYRVIWTDNELEKRLADFEDYVPGTNVLIRRVREVREVKKYSYLKPQWLLEKLFINIHNNEILDNSTLAPQSCTYEPFWAFGHEQNGRAKRPVWRAIELIITAVNNPRKLTPSEMNDEELAQAFKDEELMSNLMNEYIPNDALHSSVKDGDTVMLNDANRKQNG